ncbi:sodium:alanine symporter family protein [Shewanella sp. Choline-02u-19]|uniref:alanine/glycine:cation symporter family protein n=1 Tax=unclassified Shewanella TaxID=196818 RepID=UPI000C332C29|nr:MULTISPECIES: alanine/glycine:cation symporter family protein [unclassified Shewanella]PKG57190.1 sodium:alanine symporter family protein [Shewanella sp. GutDb-MelDb]PKG76427.1 sodium:alanine symporter family protein [Shewanella sp. GutCb]PKH57549.1 sodium:alanine symporter family protein [Shewanella sp. Bg11-22]PKI28411.1 sodium:alanine symporter family protein [Shewanella sp. Choline-02u-19]
MFEPLINAVESAVNAVNGLLWGSLLIYVLVAAGVLFTFRLGFIQFRLFGHGVKLVIKGREKVNGISSFQVFCTSMAARVGTGNMAGVAVAITVGGAGAIFWMWLIALLGMATAFIESTLAQVYKVKDDEGQYRGGPAYYMEKGLGKRWMGTLFSILLIIAFGFAFNAAQANTMTDALNNAFGLDKTIVGLVIVMASAYIICGGLKKVARASELIVPVMAVAYLAVAIAVLVLNIEQVPAALTLIVKSAFGWEEAAGGAMGAMMAGVARGLFSNEAGMGSAANIAASATPNPNHPASQGFVQMIGVFVDTIVICTASAAIILLSGVLDNPGEHKGIGLLQLALSNELGGWSAYFIAFAIILFCFSSIIANYSYAENNIMFLTKSKKVLYVFRVLVLAMVMTGSVASLQLVWNFADVSMGLMALVNISAIVLLSKVAFAVVKDYERQIKAGVSPTFDASQFPEIKGIETGEWTNDEPIANKS